MSNSERFSMELPVDKIEEAPWKLNEMTPETYKLLLNDMKNSGPSGIAPIEVAPSSNIIGKPGYITIDGAQRLRAAKELGWATIPAFFHEEIVDEGQARLFNYRRNSERGVIDDFKLAETFKWFADKGSSQESIAATFGVDRTVVTRRLALLKLDPTVKKAAEDQDFTVSHLEPISTLPAPLQKEAMKNLGSYRWSMDKGEGFSVKQVSNTVEAIKKREALKEQWLERIAKSKFPKCPRCKQDPVFPNSYYTTSDYVQCGQGHQWGLKTGKTPNQEALENITHAGGKKVRDPNKPKVWPQKIRSEHDPVEFDTAYWGFFKELWPKLGTVDHVDLRGKLKNGEEFSLHYTVLGGYAGMKSSSISYGTGKYHDKDQIVLHVEQLVAPTLVKKGYKSYVSMNRHITSKKQLEELGVESEKFLVDFGKVPRGTPKKADK